MKESDQWLSDGDCKKCRRTSYCTKMCKKHRVNLQRLIIQGIRQKTGLDVVKKKLEESYGA